MDFIRGGMDEGRQELKLSICIATYNRGAFIAETLDSILVQMQPGVELIVLDGASPDDTQVVIKDYQSRFPFIQYFRESVNSGVDRDYDKAVSYAKGDFCWLMTDDDLLRPGAISRVIDNLSAETDLIIVNSEVKNADFTKLLNDRFLKFNSDKEYFPIDGERLFLETAQYLTFIGGVVIRRILWLERDRKSFYDTLFVHVGVIFQHSLANRTLVLSEPLITIRYGNAMWSSRGFEIWMFKWPELIWSFCGFSEYSKSQICPREPWRRLKNLVLYRAIGGYGVSECQSFLEARTNGFSLCLYKVIAIFPASIINLFACFYCALINRKARSGLYDLARSRHATWGSRLLGKLFL